MKRNSSYKSASNDLASLALASNLNTQLDLNNNSNNNTTSPILASAESNESLSSLSSFNFSKSSTYSYNSITLTQPHSKAEQHVCLSMPLAKPSLNELKPQLPIDSKMKTKSLMER
jgi:hypothetical protein